MDNSKLELAGRMLKRGWRIPRVVVRQRNRHTKVLRKPRFEGTVRDDVDLYSTDELRAEYHTAQGGYDTLIRLRNSNISREEIAAEIRWRVHREDGRFWLLAIMAFVAAIAGCAATVISWLALPANGPCG